MNEDTNSETAVAERLVASHREFHRFLESKLGDTTLAEDILPGAEHGCMNGTCAKS